MTEEPAGAVPRAGRVAGRPARRRTGGSARPPRGVAAVHEGRGGSRDPVLALARALLYGGLVLVSLMVLRVGGGITAGDVVLLTSLALCLAAVGRPRTRHPYGAWALPAAVLLVVGGCLATAGSPAPTESLVSLVRVLYVALALPWQLAVLLDDERRLRRGLLAFGVGAALCSLGALVQFVVGPGAIPGGVVTTAGRYTGFTGHVSDTGAIASLAVVIGLSGLTRGLGRLQRLVLVGVALSGIVGLVLSGSVSGMLAAVLGSAALLLLRGIPVGRVAVAAVVAGAALWFAGGVLGETQGALRPAERVQQVLGLSGGDASLNTSASRWDTIVLGWRGFLEDPISGAGLDARSSLVVDTLGVHSLPVAALYQGGVVFAAGLLGCLVVAAVRAVRSVPRTALQARVYAVGVTALAFSATAPSLYNRYLWVPAALVAAAVASGAGVGAARAARGAAAQRA
ncbi:O-antigen ligase [Cellulosimicrobium cellulans]|uniref:O-antigen ligase family protein n=1 Tax=Cellulosimicrobium cellulans TaxID=1710 RepID=A0A1Y0I0V5_CELCE|nr:hypothetical protein [Cellulosimicrobium cellulans]ARU53023.1 hypothetical protein CBR64_17860 [Cellulosimicrobium cellulans]MBM7819790.1 O-antigen ligase [Cellulosimicrobium cellulans]